MIQDSKGNEIKDGDILLSSNTICPVKYKYIAGIVYLLDNSMSSSYSFEFFKTLRPNFIKQT